MRRRWLVLAGLGVTVIGGWFLASTASGDAAVEWTEVGKGDLVLSVEVEGTLSSRDSSVLSPPPVAGFYDFQITFMAPEGSDVEVGAPVLAFDTTELERRLANQTALADEASKSIEKLEGETRQQLMDLELELAEAEASLRRARLRSDVPEDLQSSNEVAQAQLDVQIAETSVASLRQRIDAARRAGVAQAAALVARRDRAQRQILEIEAAIESMTVKAPRAGTVIYVTDWRGEKKKVGDSAWRHERIIELPNLRAMRALGEVDEADAGNLQEQQRFRVRLDAHPDVEYTGSIASIWRTVSRKSFSRNPLKVVRLDMDLDETDVRRMRPGMRFRGTIETGRIGDATLIPAHAVFPSPEGPIVFKSGFMGPDRTRVILGARNATLVQVMEGLAAGDRIAVSDPSR